MNDQTILTTAGLDKLKAELEDLKNNKRPAVIARIKEAVSYGDLSENSEYEDAKNEQGFIEGRIADLEATLKNAKVVESQGGDSVALGSVVTVKHNGDTAKFTIVGHAEADPTEGLVSFESPIGKALLDKKVGDDAVVETPKGEVTYKVLSLA